MQPRHSVAPGDLDFSPDNPNVVDNLSQWSYLVNTIPNATGQATETSYNPKTGTFTITGKQIWDVYQDVLVSQVHDTPLSGEDETKRKRALKWIRKTKTYEDPDTGETKEKLVDALEYVDYLNYKAAYEVDGPSTTTSY